MVNKGPQKSKNKVSSQKAAPPKKTQKESKPVTNGADNLEVPVQKMDIHEEGASNTQVETPDRDQKQVNGKDNGTVPSEPTAEAAVVQSEEAAVESGDADVVMKETVAEPQSQSKESEVKMDSQPSGSEEKPAVPQTTRSRKRKAAEPAKEVVKPKEAKVEEVLEEIEAAAMDEEAEATEEEEPKNKRKGKQAKSAPVSKPVRLTRGRKAASAAAVEVKVKATKAGKKPSALVATKPKRAQLDIPAMKTVSGKVFVIGTNDTSQLGFGEDVEIKSRPALLDLPNSIVDIVAGGMHSVCLTESGEVFTFGCNDEGTLGRVTSDEELECTPRKVELREKIIQISAGDSHTAALAESGQVYIWGNFRCMEGAMGLLAEGVIQPKPVAILNGVKVVKISSGTEHLACLSNEGLVYTLGCGENGQLGRVPERRARNGGREGRAIFLQPAVVPVFKGSKTLPIQDIWCGSYCTFLKTQDTNAIYAFGLNNYNQLGCENENDETNTFFFPKLIPSFSSKSWLVISGGQHHTIALDSDNLVFALGRSDYGRLGLGENCQDKTVPTVISTLENEKCSSVSCGNLVSYAVTEDGSVYSWGMGTNYQLGHGNDDDYHVPTLIEGNFIKTWKAFKVSGGGQHTLLLAKPK